MERLQATFDKLLRETTSTFHRYMYDRIDWQARVVGLLGPRGVGKTTMVLQYIKENLPPRIFNNIFISNFFSNFV